MQYLINAYKYIYIHKYSKYIHKRSKHIKAIRSGLVTLNNKTKYKLQVLL